MNEGCTLELRREEKMTEMKITQFPDEFIKLAGTLAPTYGERYHGCAQAVVAPFLEILGISDEALLATASCFAGGCGRCQMCGAVSGGLIILGLKYGRKKLEDGIEPLDASLEIGGEMIDRFLEMYETTNCCELTGFDLGDPDQRQAFMDSKEVTKKCNERIKNVAEWVAEIICKQSGRL